MAGLIDTNVLLYSANQDAEEHPKAAAFLQDTVAASADAWYLTDGIIYEFLRVSTHPKVFERPLSWKEAVTFLTPFWKADNIGIITPTAQHWSILPRELSKITHPSGNLFFDIRSFILMLEYGVRRIYTTDTDFLQFNGIEVINPLQ